MTAQNENFLSSDSTPINLIMKRIPQYGNGGIYRSFAKRIIDIVLVLISAPIVFPVIAYRLQSTPTGTTRDPCATRRLCNHTSRASSTIVGTLVGRFQ